MAHRAIWRKEPYGAAVGHLHTAGFRRRAIVVPLGPSGLLVPPARLPRSPRPAGPRALGRSFLQAAAMPMKAAIGAVHVAIAATHGVDFLVT